MGEEKKNIVWSHSSLGKLLNNPAEYYLDYVVGIKPKQEKTALSLGSAVHWGLENGTSDLQEYYNEKGNFKQWNNYSDEQCMAEAIVDAYLRLKDQLYKQLLKDEETGEILEIIEEFHELKLTSHIHSIIFEDGHDFLGIIDLLLLTSKGWILIDYKTGSQKVDYDEYKSQLFKYINLLEFNFPEVPLYKLGVIHLQKTNIRRKRDESDYSYRQRIKMEYDLNEDNLIEAHTYDRSEFDEKQLENYIKDLSQMMDNARLIKDNNLFYINYSNIKGMYGASQYYDIFYKTKDNHALYIIKDTIYDEFDNKLTEYRNCEPIDMMVLDGKDLLNKYSKFKEETEKLTLEGFNTKDKLFTELKKKYTCDDKLLNEYLTTYKKGY